MPDHHPDDRRARLARWLESVLPGGFSLAPASADASFRRYFRVRTGDGSLIAMDAPPERESCAGFVEIAGRLRAAGLNAPEIVAADHAQGFVLLTDLGTRHYLDALGGRSAGRLYPDALDALAVMQARVDSEGLPDYDEALLRAEMSLFRDWLLGTHLGLPLDARTDAMLAEAFAALAASALEQPRVFVHRDYHSRNLMVRDRHNPGILDFQDAVRGPVTYDLVSLLRDCYFSLPPDAVTGHALGYRTRAIRSGILPEDTSERRFLRWFDLMGVQRHLKASGIFARLAHRDAKHGYLADIPRTLAYIVDVSAQYPELAALGRFVATGVLPALARAPVPEHASR